MPDDRIETPGPVGLVVRSGTDLYEVEYEGRILLASRRKKVKRSAGRVSDSVIIGDQVRLTFQENSTAVIEEVLPRKTRMGRERFGKVPQGMAANLDQILVVMSVRMPRFDSHALDRFLVLSEITGVPPVIVLNKTDLAERPEEVEELLADQRAAGYPMIRCCALTGEGIEPVRVALKDRISALAGPSGVGKSSLLNAIQPGLSLRTGGVSLWSEKGIHTTTEFRLLRLEQGGYVADMPGIKTVSFPESALSILDECFPEMLDRLGQCKFQDCSHVHEPGCAVRTAVETGAIPQSRYQSYRKIRTGE